MNISERVNNMQASPIRRLIPYAEKAKKRGIKVLHLNIGQPDIKTPQIYFDYIKNYSHNIDSYSHSAGIAELREKFCEFYNYYDVNLSSDEIVITQGGSEAIIMSLSVIADPGDEVLVVEPFYANYKGFAGMVNVNLVPVNTTPEVGYKMPDVIDFENKITEKTRAILFSNPCNPTGAVYSRNEIEKILKLAKKYNLWIICDEVYREFVFDNLEPFSILSFKDYSDRIIMIDSISKRYSACGARVGLLAAKNKDFHREVIKIAQARLSPSTLPQIGTMGLLSLGREYINNIKKEYQYRRDIVYEELSKVDGLYFKKPRGAFYVSVLLPVDDSEKFVKWLLTDFNVNGYTTMVAPLSGFYVAKDSGKREVRVAYVLDDEKIKFASSILAKGLIEYDKLTKEKKLINV